MHDMTTHNLLNFCSVKPLLFSNDNLHVPQGITRSSDKRRYEGQTDKYCYSLYWEKSKSSGTYGRLQDDNDNGT